MSARFFSYFQSCNFTMPKRKLYGITHLRRECKQLQLYHAKAETYSTCAPEHSSRCGCNFTMPKRKRCVAVYTPLGPASCNFTMPKRKLEVASSGASQFSVATLPCQSGNSVDCKIAPENYYVLQLYHAKAETCLLRFYPLHRRSCNFTMPKRKLAKRKIHQVPLSELQLYHAKAETSFHHVLVENQILRCNFTMPKRKLYHPARCNVPLVLQLYHAKAETRMESPMTLATPSLQLYHAKAETSKAVQAMVRFCHVATLPCQSGNCFTFL